MNQWPVWAAATAIVLTIVAFARMGDSFGDLSAHESAAIGGLRNIVIAQKEFRSQNGCFASELGQLPDVTSRDHSYAYAVLPQASQEKGCVTKYIVTASPVSTQERGARYFSLDEAETLRFEKTHPAGPNSAILK